MAEDYKEFEGGFYTKGAILEVGTFTPGSSKSGEPVTISESDFEELYNNIKGPIPFAIGHGDFAPIIGHATKFRKNGATIEHKGIVSDPNSFKTIVINENYRNISPEIELIRVNGKVVGKRISKLCFVPNPSMPNTQTEITRLKFSAPEVTMTDSQTSGTIESTTNNPVPPKTETPVKTTENNTSGNIDIAALAEVLSAGISKKFEEQIATLKTEIETLKGSPGKDFFTKPKTGNRGRPKKIETSQESDGSEDDGEPQFTALLEAEPINPVGKEVFDEYAKTQLALQEKDRALQAEKQRIDGLYKSQLDNIITDIKNHNVDVDPFIEQIKSMSIENQISVLQAYRSQVIKNQPMISNPSSNGMQFGNEGGSSNNKETFAERAKLAGVDFIYKNKSPEYLKALSDKLGWKFA
jgi:hypothetical protein